MDLLHLLCRTFLYTCYKNISGHFHPTTADAPGSDLVRLSRRCCCTYLCYLSPPLDPWCALEFSGFVGVFDRRCADKVLKPPRCHPRALFAALGILFK
ncbi:hypothetical protein S245_006517 [Arachis hypogaea]